MDFSDLDILSLISSTLDHHPERPADQGFEVDFLAFDHHPSEVD